MDFSVQYLPIPSPKGLHMITNEGADRYRIVRVDFDVREPGKHCIHEVVKERQHRIRLAQGVDKDKVIVVYSVERVDQMVVFDLGKGGTELGRVELPGEGYVSRLWADAGQEAFFDYQSDLCAGAVGHVVLDPKKANSFVPTIVQLWSRGSSCTARRSGTSHSLTTLPPRRQNVVPALTAPPR